MDLADIAARLRKLTPRQEKVIRLYFGLGCQRPHSAKEVAQEFGVSVPVIAGIIFLQEVHLHRLHRSDGAAEASLAITIS